MLIHSGLSCGIVAAARCGFFAGIGDPVRRILRPSGRSV
jgi:hypothetical protein